jgi:hypothetical protein
VVICGGANVIHKNATVAVKNVCSFVERKVNILIIKSPHRHDLIPSTCVNNEMLNFNKKVENENL